MKTPLLNRGTLWFELHEELFMYGLMSRADFITKSWTHNRMMRKFSLNHENLVDR